MTMQDFIDKSGNDIISMDVLTKLAADRNAYGADVEAAFSAQAEQRAAAGLALLEDAQKRAEERKDDRILASDQRKIDQYVRDRDSVLGLLRGVQARGAEAYAVPRAVAAITDTKTTDESPVLTREQPVSKWLRDRGGYAYCGERGVEGLRFGRIVRALALGNRSGLSALEQRALAEGSDASGGYSVPEVLAASFIDRVRNNMVVMRAGAQTVPMTSDVLHLARLAQPDSISPAIAAPTWKAENQPIDEYDMVLERVTFTARTLPCLIKLSVELSEDSVNIDQIIEREMSQALALELDRVALLGSGTPPEPRGIQNQSGVGVTSFGSDPADYDFLVDAIGRVWAQNHEPNARIYNSNLAVLLAKLKDNTNQPLRAPDVVTAVPAFITNQIGNAGISPDTTTMFVGDFSQLMVGMRTSFRLEVTRVAGEAFEKLQIWVRAYLRADVQLAHPEAFDVSTNVGI